MQAARTLLVAATGGHLEELYRIHRRFSPPSGSMTWVTHDDPQSRSLLAGEVVEHVDYVPPRGYSALLRILPQANRIVRDGRFDRVVSTGAGIALPFFLAARARGVPCHYIESAARADGPSLTGSLASRIPGTRLYSQYQSWAGSRWSYRGSLFDDFDVTEAPDGPVRRVVVTLGTMRTFEFGRLVDRLVTVLPEVVEPGAEILWQLGATSSRPPFGDVRTGVPHAELRSAIAAADLVVTHAGIGSALTALELGRRPVLVPRLSSHDEHVDDHQLMIADELGERGLAVSVGADLLEAGDLRRAVRGRVATEARPSSFTLVD
ncbi:glycosyltransferase [Isoptericola jiangsuensis]|uniref:glycosyltransferase n=1 Tax=Isoptericola jiangsuensis TaxID=548579 RepID=UPI003AB0705E